MLDATVSVFVSELADGKTIGIHGFGQLEVKKREERIFSSSGHSGANFNSTKVSSKFQAKQYT